MKDNSANTDQAILLRQKKKSFKQERNETYRPQNSQIGLPNMSFAHQVPDQSFRPRKKSSSSSSSESLPNNVEKRLSEMKAAETSYSKKFEGPLKNAVPKRRSSSSSSSSGSKMPYTITTSQDEDRTKPFSYIHEKPTISKSKLAKSASQKRAKERKLSSSSSSSSSSSDHVKGPIVKFVGKEQKGRKLSSSSSSSSSSSDHVKGPKVKFVGKTKYQPKPMKAALPDVKVSIGKSDSDSSSISSDSTTINMRSSAVTSPTDWGDSQAPSTEHLIKKADSWLNKADKVAKPMQQTNLKMVESDSTSVTSFTSTNDTDGQRLSIQKLNPVQTPVLNARLVKHKGLNTSVTRKSDSESSDSDSTEVLDYSGSLQIPKLQSRVRSPSVSKSTSSSSSSDSPIKPSVKMTTEPKLMAPPAYKPRQSNRLVPSSSEDESSVSNVRGATGSKKVPLNDVKIKTPSPPSSIVSGIFIFTFIQSSTYSST